MKRISLVVSILCASFVSVAWGQQPAGKCTNDWSEFHRTNMQRWNPCENVLGVNNVGDLGVKWSYDTLLLLCEFLAHRGEWSGLHHLRPNMP
jgi:hypothetical protein